MIWIERENEEPARPRQDENKRRNYVTKENAETFQVQSEKGRKCRVRINLNCYNKIYVPQVKEKYMKRQAGLSELSLKKFPIFSNIYIYFMIQIL